MEYAKRAGTTTSVGGAIYKGSQHLSKISGDREWKKVKSAIDFARSLSVAGPALAATSVGQTLLKLDNFNIVEALTGDVVNIASRYLKPLPYKENIDNEEAIEDSEKYQKGLEDRGVPRDNWSTPREMPTAYDLATLAVPPLLVAGMIGADYLLSRRHVSEDVLYSPDGHVVNRLWPRSPTRNPDMPGDDPLDPIEL